MSFEGVGEEVVIPFTHVPTNSREVENCLSRFYRVFAYNTQVEPWVDQLAVTSYAIYSTGGAGNFFPVNFSDACFTKRQEPVYRRVVDFAREFVEERHLLPAAERLFAFFELLKIDKETEYEKLRNMPILASEIVRALEHRARRSANRKDPLDTSFERGLVCCLHGSDCLYDKPIYLEVLQQVGLVGKVKDSIA